MDCEKALTFMGSVSKFLDLKTFWSVVHDLHADVFIRQIQINWFME